MALESFAQNRQDYSSKLWEEQLQASLASWRGGDVKGAVSWLEAALQHEPRSVDIYRYLAAFHLELGEKASALTVLRKAVELNPNDSSALNNMCVISRDLGNLQDALQYANQALEVSPDLAETLYNKSVVLRDLDRFDEAAQACRSAIRLSHDYVQAHNNLGCILLESGQTDKAISQLRQASRLFPNEPEIWVNLGHAFEATKRLREAASSYGKALALDPPDGSVCARLFRVLRQSCNWARMKQVEQHLEQLTQDAIRSGSKSPEHPHSHVTRSYDSERSLQIARSWAEDIRTHTLNHSRHDFGVSTSRPATRKIRLGYLSCQFRDHPLSHLMWKVFEAHDRTSFEVYAYSYAKPPGDSYTAAIRRGCDRFADLFGQDDQSSAQEIFDDEIDILVDLRGHGTGSRMGILALRPAPLQVHYLGFPGSTGADFIDYFIADETVCPPYVRRHFSEKIIFMPNSYQVNDSDPDIAQKVFSRREQGLGEDSLVFSSFNALYKLNPQLFGIWLEILRVVPRSQLWLFGGQRSAKWNLKWLARQAGISSERLVFAERLEKREHLSRLRLADLALDTFPCNGHTTTSDALRAGVPVITTEGRHFSSRVSASLLRAVDMPELITKDERQYLSLSVELGEDKSRLQHVRQELAQKLPSAKLFDTTLFVNNLELALREIWVRHQRGEKTRDVYVRKLAI